jgi:hypothetical protein
MKNLNFRTPKEIREEIREYLNSGFIPFEDEKFKKLIQEQKESEQRTKQNNMFLFIEGQNIINQSILKLIPIYFDLINGIIGEKFYNIDNSRSHKFKDIFNDLEGTETVETKKYKYRISTQTRHSHNCFYLDCNIYIWNDRGSYNIENSKYLATLENQTSFKEVNQYNNDNDFKTYILSEEVKKMQKYEDQKKKLQQTKDSLNSKFCKVFYSDFERDNF